MERKKVLIAIAGLLILLTIAMHAGEERVIKAGFVGKDGFDTLPAKIPFSMKEAEASKRKVIKNAYLKLEVENFYVALHSIENAITEVNGYVSCSQSYVTSSKHRKGSITAKIPKDKLTEFLNKIETLGEVKYSSISGRDVTEEYIDLEARLKNYEAEERNLLKIMEKAEKVEDILKIEKELARIRGEIEVLKGRIRYLNNRVEFATVTIEIFEPEPITSSFGIRNALRQAFLGFVKTLNSMIILIGYALPLAIITFVAYLMYKRKKGVPLAE